MDMIQILAEGLNILYLNNIIHRDIHPSRILLFNQYDKDNNLKEVIKFNIVGMPFNFKKLLKRHNFAGHVNYSIPELILENNNFSNKVDVWSLGCCIYYLITKRDPFDGKGPHETKNNILNLQVDRYSSLQKFSHEKISNLQIKHILTCCLCLEESMRPSFQQIIDQIKLYE